MASSFPFWILEQSGFFVGNTHRLGNVFGRWRYTINVKQSGISRCIGGLPFIASTEHWRTHDL
jgi:hypothetical protein